MAEFRDMAVFMFAKTDWEALREERAYFERERREGMVCETELMMEDEGGDGSGCRGEGASFILATQDMIAVESWLLETRAEGLIGSGGPRWR
jgi:hypothetical protein